MRRLPSRSRLPITGAIGLALALSTTAGAQETSPARYVPKDNVALYVEYQGLDAQADAWKKTAAYKILNNTPAGAMIDSVVLQLLDRLPTVDPKGKPIPIRGSELFAVVKHMARSGFVFAVVDNKESPEESPYILVIRNGFKNKEISPILARMTLGTYAANTKPQSVVRAGHKIIGGVDATGHGFAWWVEDSKKEDFVFLYTPPESADVILETLDGKRPNAISHPRRADLIKAENGFQPTGLAFVEPAFLRKIYPNAERLGLADFSKFDVRWGFQDEALLTIARLVTPSPRQGIPALLEGSTFDKGKLPPIPEAATGFTVASFDMPATLDRLVGLVKVVKPDAEDQVKKLVDTFQEKTKLRLKEDLLANLGPKVAWFTLPTKKPAGPAGLAGMLGGGLEIPKFAVVLDIANPSGFGKVLDQLILAINRELKAAGKTPADPAAKGSRAKAASGPSIAFRPTPGEGKGFVLNIPQELANPMIPTTFRPTIRIGPKPLVIAASPEMARLVLDLKGSWTPPSNLAVAYQALPANLKVLNVTDPRDTLPDLLAAFPGKIQQLAATTQLMRPVQAPAGGAPKPGLVLKIDPANIPSADSIRALLFPSLLSIESTGDEIRVVSRDAFPALGDPSGAVPLILPAIQVMRNRQAAAPAGAAPGGPALPTPKAGATTKPAGAGANNPK